MVRTALQTSHALEKLRHIAPTQESFELPLDHAVGAIHERFHGEKTALDLCCGWGRNVSEAGPHTNLEWFGADRTFYAHWILGDEKNTECDALRQLASLYPHAPKNRFILDDAHTLNSIPDESFHLVISLCGVTYLNEPRAIQTINRILKPDGLAIFHGLRYENWPSHPNPYSALQTTRADAFRQQQDRGVQLYEIPGRKSTLCVLRKTEIAPQFPKKIVSSDATQKYATQYHP
jgi:SAM-dependent methyltransferase